MTDRAIEISVFDDRPCCLGEGPLWHPLRKQLFWFDILEKRLLSRTNADVLSWQFEEIVSAAGWIDMERLLIASETALLIFNIGTGGQTHVVDLEADNGATRSNDGRTDPWGGFWIGTMGKAAEPAAGCIYRYFDGRLEPLNNGITVPNSICFSPDRKWAYFADSLSHQIMRQALDGNGWPCAEPVVFTDLSQEGLIPDGSVIDSHGYLWNAQWGAARVARYSPTGELDQILPLPASQPSCPAFGGPDLRKLFVTTAREMLKAPTPADGVLYQATLDVAGLPEYQVLL